MNDPPLMSGLQRHRDLPRNRQRLLHPNGAPREAIRQCGTFHQLEHQRVHAVRFFQAMDARDIGVIERGQHLRFALEALHSVAGEGERSREHFERNIAVELDIVRTINFAHAAAAQQGSETKVPPENCAFMEANCRPAIQQGIAFCVAGEHPLNFRDQARITATGLIDKALALGGRKFDGGLENLADFAKLVRAQYAERLRLVHRNSLAGSVPERAAN